MKRFYKTVSVEPVQDGFQVHLDGKAVKTQLGNPQVVPGETLAKELAQEWNKQGDEIDQASFRYRDLADFAVDMVTPDREEHITKLLSFLETDTLCYRAHPDEPSFKHQDELWEPIVTAFEARENVTLERVCGIMHRPQATATIDTLAARLKALDPFTMTACVTLTSLAASLVIGLSAFQDNADKDALWDAANLEQDWQIEQWGQDAEARFVRERRTADFANAWNFLQLLRS